MNFVKTLFGSEGTKKNSSTALQGALVAELGGLEEKDQDFVVGLAGLMSSVAHRDFEVCEGERKAIAVLRAEHTELSENIVTTVTEVTLAHGESLAGLEDYKYIRLLNSILSKSDRQDVVRILFRVAIANDDVSGEEEHHIGLISRDMKISRARFIEIRNEFAEFVAVLNKNT